MRPVTARGQFLYNSLLSRLAKLWIPLGKKLVLEGGIVSGNRIFTEQPKTVASGKAWQPTFDAKDFHPEMSQQYLDELGNFGPYTCIDAPDYWMLQKASRKYQISSPAPDGIPYWA